jgi:Dullard-like phosphatase family protein
LDYDEEEEEERAD